jgi:hypothetical protein
MPSDVAIAATTECLTMMAEAKSALVKIDGIGSELLPAIVAWSHGEPIGYAILQNPFVTPKMIHTSLTIATRLMVSGWHADALAITMEGYVENADPFVDNMVRGLAQRFPTDSSVSEALWTAYANVDNEFCMGVSCFKQDVGRIVRFDDPELSSDDQLEDFHEQGSIPNIIVSALKETTPTPIPKQFTIEECRKRMAIEIHMLGFMVYMTTGDSWMTEYEDDPLNAWTIPDYPNFE